MKRISIFQIYLTRPYSLDDITTRGEFHVPVNHPVIIDVSSKDVIHDLCIPNMRIAQDAIPGSVIPMWFIPIKEGTYEVVCAQLCGNGHSAMKGTLVVESEATYKEWYQGVLDLKMQNMKPAAKAAQVSVPVSPAIAQK